MVRPRLTAVRAQRRTYAEQVSEGKLAGAYRRVLQLEDRLVAMAACCKCIGTGGTDKELVGRLGLILPSLQPGLHMQVATTYDVTQKAKMNAAALFLAAQQQTSVACHFHS